MKDWKGAYGAPPARFGEAVERALREKEGRKMVHGRKRWTVILIAALVTALLAGMGYAAVNSGLLDALRGNDIEPEEGAEAIIQKDLGSVAVGDVTMAVTEAAYTGETLDVMIRITGSGLEGDPAIGESEEADGKDVVGTIQPGGLFFALSEVAPQGAEVVNQSSQSWLDSGDVVTEWHTFVLGEGAPDRLKVAVVGRAGGETLLLDFSIDKSGADERALISEKTASDDGTLTVYALTVSRSMLSQAATVDFAVDLPAPQMGYWIEFLDADGNRLESGSCGILREVRLADGTAVYRQAEIFDSGAEIAAVRVYDTGSKERFGTVAVPAQ